MLEEEESLTVTLRRVRIPDHFHGRLYRHSMPGRHETLDEFLSAAEREGIDLIACLAPPEELREKSPAYAKAVAAGSLPMLVHACPIEDYGLPDTDWDFQLLMLQLGPAVQRGERVLVHCAAGVGRTGLVLECLLGRMGVKPRTARRRVAAVGAGAETDAQRLFIRRDRSRYREALPIWSERLRRSVPSSAELLRRADRMLETVRRRHAGFAEALDGLHFVVNERFTVTAGRAYWRAGRVELSGPIFRDARNARGLRNTVLHEIAHVLANRVHEENCGHDERWRGIFLELGGDGLKHHSLLTPP